MRLGGAAMEGQGNRQGWVGANAEHRLGCACVWVGSETEEAFRSPNLPQFQSFQQAHTLPSRSAAPQQLFVN